VKKIEKRTLRDVLTSVLLIVSLGVLIANCSPKVSTQKLSEVTQSLTNTSDSATRTTLPILTPTWTLPTPTISLNQLGYLPITVTLGANVVPRPTSVDDDYIYKDEIVTFQNVSWNSTIYLNLDNLADNGQQNSDFVIYVDSGSAGTTLEIYPTNYARYSFNDAAPVDYVTCVDSIASSETADDYDWSASLSLRTGNSYCFITNEGHIAILNLLNDSVKQNEQGDLDISIQVTVYKKIPQQLITPTPTALVRDWSLFPERYYGLFITDEQAELLDRSIQNFLDALSRKDKEGVSEFFDYPFEARSYKDGSIIFCNSSDEIIANFDRIFDSVIISEAANATLENNVYSDDGYVILAIKNYEIRFSTDTKAVSIIVK